MLLRQDESNSLAPLRILITSNNSDPDVISLNTGLKAIMMLTDILLNESDAYVVNGMELIFDLGPIRYNYVAQATPNFLKSVIFFLQRTLPARIKGAYYINVPSFFLPMIKLATSFLPKKKKDRVTYLITSQ